MVLIVGVLLFMLCIAWLTAVLTATDGVETVIHRKDAIILLSTLLLLLTVFILARLLSYHRRAVTTILWRAPVGLAIVLFLFLPHSSALYGRIADAVQSDVVLFTVWNLLDIAVGRILIALLKRDGTSLLAESEHGPSPDHR
jgi:hypothetical protein